MEMGPMRAATPMRRLAQLALAFPGISEVPLLNNGWYATLARKILSNKTDAAH
jgi:hypothetical protein